MRFLFALLLWISVVSAANAQEGGELPAPESILPAQTAMAASQIGPVQQDPQVATAAQGKSGNLPDAPSQPVEPHGPITGQEQPKRILGFMPNYRAVSAGVRPEPPSPKQSFLLATQNSFDYSSFLFVGLTSLLAEGTEAHPDLGKGIGGFWAYSWRGFLDKTDGNYMVLWALPSVFHEDERYYAMGHGGFWRRSLYASSRVLITPNYQGHNTINKSELLGRAGAQAVSTTYYPAGDDTTLDLAEKFGYSIGRDALTNVFREFWPDIATHVLHRHP